MADMWIGLNGITRDEVPYVVMLVFLLVAIGIIVAAVVSEWRDRR